MGSSPLYPITSSVVSSDIGTAIREQQRGSLPQLSGQFFVPGWEFNNMDGGFAMFDDAPQSFAYPIEVKQAINVTGISMRFGTGSGNPNGRCRVALFTMDPTTGLPADLVFNHPEFTIANSGTKTVADAQTLPAGLYWQVIGANTAGLNASAFTWFEASSGGAGTRAFGVRGPVQKFFGAVPTAAGFTQLQTPALYLLAIPDSYISSGFPADMSGEAWQVQGYGQVYPPIVFYQAA